jgi:DNA-binding NarL/FixJ family response regulator
MKKLNFLLVDDEALVREGLRALLEKEDFVNQVIEAGNKGELESALSQGAINIVLLDFRMPDANGLELYQIIKKQPQLPMVIALTGLEGPELIINLLKAGVNGIVYKLDGYREVLNAINAVIDTGTYFPQKILGIIRQNSHQLGEVPPVQLTFHEKELLKAIAQGFTTKQIASLLRMSESTTETYRIRLIKKVKVSNTAGLLAYAFRNGIL